MQPPRLLLIGLATGIAAPALAQQIPYETGQYEYAQDPAGQHGDDVVTESAPVPSPRPAERVIAPRRDPGTIRFVSSPTVQGSSPSLSTPVASPAAPQAVVFTGQGPVYYAGSFRPDARPGTGAVALQPPAGYVEVPPGLPAGSRIVAFDRTSWLAACRARLEGYRPEDRAGVLASLGAAAHGYSPGQDDCTSYLDSYLASASAGSLTIDSGQTGEYILVPVTVRVEPAGNE